MIFVAGILLIAGVLALVGGSVSKHGGVVAGGIGAALLGLVIGIFSMSYTQDPGEAKVVKSFTGEVQAEADTTEGLGWHAPLDSLIDYDIRNKLAAFSNQGNTKVDPKDLLGGELDFSDKDRVSGKMDIFVTYSITPDKVVDIYRQYGDQEKFEATVISPQVKSTIKSVPGSFSTSEMMNERAKVATAIEAAFKARWESLGVTVDSVDIQDVRYPESVTAAFAEAQNARTRVTTEEANLKAVEVSAQQKVVQAKADAESNRLLNESLTENVLKNRELDALRYVAEKGNLIISDGNSLIEIPAKK